MTLLGLVLLLILVGVGLNYVNTHIPMTSTIKTLLNVVVVVVMIILVLQAFGLMSYLYTPVHQFGRS